MRCEPTRRSFMAAIGASAAGAVCPPITLARDEPSAPAYRTAGELVEALAGKEVSSRELVEAAISRIERIDPKINAVVVRDFARAREAAAAADAALAKRERQPLLGLPMTVKEQFNVVGLPTSWGDRQFWRWYPAADTLAVQRLKNAGAVILGKTNVPLHLTDWQSYNDIFGTTNNPWDPSRTELQRYEAGAAAALAAGFVPLELGADIGGSLRAGAFLRRLLAQTEPRPHSATRLGFPRNPGDDPGSRRPLGDRPDGAQRRRSRPRAGPDEWSEGIGYKLVLPPPHHDRLTDFRVLVIDRHPLCPTEVAVSAALDRLAERLVKTGCQVARGGPNLPDLAQTSRIYSELLSAFFSADLPAAVGEQVAATARALSLGDESLAAAGLRGLTMSHPDWMHASRIRSGLRARWQALFRKVDVVLCPPMPTVAFPHDHSPQFARILDVDGAKVPYFVQSVWAGIATLNGMPATTMPIARTENGLPIGMQIIGGFLDDRTTIAFAGQIEREFGGFTPPPGF